MTPQTHRIAFLFPGQGSQSIGMGKALADAYPVARDTFAEANEILGFPLSQLAWEGPEEMLNDTVNTQPALFVHSAAALRVLKQDFPQIQPDFVAGHSMGELSALFAAGSLPFEEGLNLVRTRGELMHMADEIAPGAMAAILALDIPTLEEICATASTVEEVVQVANDNCPGQVVISGDRNALERAVGFAKERGARKAVILPISIAAHSELMAPAQEQFNQAVSSAPISEPEVPIIGNVNARPLRTQDEVRADLMAQLNSRVRWTESMQYLIAQGVDSFYEIGNESVLCGLLKRIDRDFRGIPLGNPEDFEKLSAV